MAALSVVFAPPKAGHPVVVTTKALPAGEVVAAADVRLVDVPDGLAPVGALTTLGAAVGATLAVGQPEGAMLTEVAIGGSDSWATRAPGEVLVPFRLSDPAVATLLEVGTLVSVIGGTGDGGSAVVATHARVAALPSDGDRGLLGGAAPSTALIVVATTPEQAQRIATASGTSLGVLIE